MIAHGLFADVPVPAPIPSAQHVRADGRTYWADCARCGVGTLPATTTRNVRIRGQPTSTIRIPIVHPQGYPGDAFEIRADANGHHRRATLGTCATCGSTVPLRVIRNVQTHATRPLERCGAACLNGRNDCTCRCRGRCHGAGVCRCGNR